MRNSDTQRFANRRVKYQVKKSGWILYYGEDLKKNKRFVEIVTNTLEKENIQVKVIVLDDTNMGELLKKESPDFVINRSRNYKVAKVLENKGIRVFNNATVTEIANDKEKTYEFFKNEISFMPILKSTTKDFPFVMKSCSGHGGTQVYFIENEMQLENAKKELKDQKYLCQEFCNEPGKDLRVYVINKEIVVAMLRQAESGFKSNYSLGGSAEIYQLSEKEKKVVYKIVEKLNMDYVGIDFIFHNHKIMLNEIEDAVGARMVYENTDINILERFAMYAAKEME